jgi:thioredoxin-like negative regulator of GroEL
MDAVTYPDPVVREELAAWVLERVDVARSPEVARLFGVVAVPIAIAVEPDGAVRERILGFVEPAELAARLRALRAARGGG